jgi:hypothetical protein
MTLVRDRDSVVVGTGSREDPVARAVGASDTRKVKASGTARAKRATKSRERSVSFMTGLLFSPAIGSPMGEGRSTVS